MNLRSSPLQPNLAEGALLCGGRASCVVLTDSDVLPLLEIEANSGIRNGSNC
jgi:hypothetical protein